VTHKIAFSARGPPASNGGKKSRTLPLQRMRKTESAVGAADRLTAHKLTKIVFGADKRKFAAF
jgi:hypothetical protein